MKIDVLLPPKFETRWCRLLAYQGGDDEALALAAVELLWKSFGGDVQKSERLYASRMKRIAECKRKLANIPIWRKGALEHTIGLTFVGRFERRIGETGLLTFPQHWFEQMGRPNGIWLYPNPRERSIRLLADADADKALKSGKKLVPTMFDARRRIRIDKDILTLVGLTGKVLLLGRMRYVVICGLN